MSLKSISLFYILLSSLPSFCFAQVQEEVIPPYNIKTVSFVQNNINMVPVFRLGDGFQLQFDDLFGNELDYYYTIIFCDYDWKPSLLAKHEYMEGFDNLRIIDYKNSFNTLQLYSHYRLSLPNPKTRLKLSGNYILKILNSDRKVIFSRKFILYEDLVSVPVQIRRARTFNMIDSKQNLEFSIISRNFFFVNPIQNIKILLMQNGRWDDVITNIKPQFILGNDLIYRYDTETQFWGGNEFLNFDNKDIRSGGGNVSEIILGDIYSSVLNPTRARANRPYTYNPDVNGNFVVRNFNTPHDNDVTADYAWVYFSLSAPGYYENKNIYITGMFNNYAKTPEYKMDYNPEKGIYEKALIIKQGFTNYQYTIYDNGKIDHENAIDGNFQQTENDYFVLVYYRGINERYDRIIGKGINNSINIIN